MVTRNDVAARAGTSTAVVSYVVNGGPRQVSEATRQRVLAAIEELGYRPNKVARALRSSASQTLGMIVPDLLNPYFAELASAIERAAFELGYAVLIGNAMRDDAQQARYLAAFAQHQVDGLLLVGVTQALHEGASATSQELRIATKARVFLERLAAETDGVAVVADNEQGAYDATAHLLGHGHKAVASLTGPADLEPTRERERGWQRALREAGLDPAQQMLRRSAFSRIAGFEVGLEMLADPAKRPSAIFVHSDEQAFGVIRAAQRLGLSVPDDFALISFDGIGESALVQPALTTVSQPIAELARQAVLSLVGLVQGSAPPSQVLTLPVQLTIRRSCGCRHHDGADHQAKP